MTNFQIHARFPEMEEKIFRVEMISKKDGTQGWDEYVPAETSEEAEEKAKKALEALGKENDFYLNYEPSANADSYFMPRFSGNVTPENWPAELKGVPDQYISACSMGGINLHIYALGRYTECQRCENQKSCLNEASCAAEQSS